MGLRFEVLATCGAARRGRLHTPHGVVETPAFMPVGTLGAVKGVRAEELEDAGASVMLSNLYHLTLRPGIDVIEGLGGIHAFTGWNRPILTDSGGYQVFSLADLRTVDDGGVTFRNHLDGTRLRFTPESVVDSQRRIGVDMAMVLDECPPWPISEDEAAKSLALTSRWAEAARRAWPEGTAGGLFGIAQGSAFKNLRLRAAAHLADLDFDGYAVGGVSVGEDPELRRSAIEWTVPALPEGKARYLMGLGTPTDLVHAIGCGVDLFDCVLPARNARHGNLFTRNGMVKIKNARYRDDPRPVEAGCPCPLCRCHSRAFLHHMIRAKEITGMVYATLHNIRFYLDFVTELREGIALGTLPILGAELALRFTGGGAASSS